MNFRYIFLASSELSQDANDRGGVTGQEVEQQQTQPGSVKAQDKVQEGWKRRYLTTAAAAGTTTAAAAGTTAATETVPIFGEP